MFSLKRSKNLLYAYFGCTALLALCLMFSYIPKARAIKYDELTTLREIIPSKTEYYLYVGDADRIDIGLVPETAVTDLVWTSADQSVISVSEGRIESLSEGKSAVTVTGNGGVSAGINVTVIKKPVPPGSDLPEYYEDELLIANVSHPLGADYLPELVYVPSKYPSPRKTQVTPEMLDAYEAMYADCKKATGSGFVLLSGYRSYEKQVQLFDEDVSAFIAKGYSTEEAKKKAGLTTQLPGCSEHQLGLSVDISTNYDLSNGFRNTKVGKWVTENCWKYGMVLRYPQGKYDYTLIDHEAWHFRLIGGEHSVEHARYIYEHGLCLEEYIELQQKTREAAEKYAAEISAEEYCKKFGEAGTSK